MHLRDCIQCYWIGLAVSFEKVLFVNCLFLSYSGFGLFQGEVCVELEGF